MTLHNKVYVSGKGYYGDLYYFELNGQKYVSDKKIQKAFIN